MRQEIKEMETGRTTIVMDSNTREKLKKLGDKGDSYEDIIIRLMQFYQERKGEG